MRRARRRARAGALAAAIAVVLVSAACEVPSLLVPTHNLLYDVYARGPGTAGLVALTFDDGPNGRCTAEILDVLAATHTPATFFVLGTNLQHADNAALLARMVREGHTVGLHGWAHSTNPTMDEAWAAAELARTREAIVGAARAAGLEPPPARFFRPPFGFLTGPMVRAAGAAGLAVVEWTVSVEDWRPGWTAESLSDAIAHQVRAGDVIVLHDGNETAHDSTSVCVDRPVHARAVRRIIAAIRARSLRVASLAEVLAVPEPPSR